MIDTTGKTERKEPDDDGTPDSKSHFQRPSARGDESDDDDDRDSATSSRGGKVLLLGFVCAAAAGTYFYAKKNSIDVEGIVRSKVQALYEHFRSQK